MLHKLTFSNFYSFADKAEISFVVTEHAKTEWYTTTDTGTRLTKVLATLGANGSGKTNVLRVGAFLSWFIEFSFTKNDSNDEIPVQNFSFKKRPKQGVSFGADFELKGVLYSYLLEVSSKQVLHESLQAKDPKTSNSFSTLFKRDWDKKKKQYDFVFKNYNAPRDLGKIVRKNASVISAGAQIEHELSEELRQYWANVSSNVSTIGKNHFSDEQTFPCAEFFYQNPKLKQKAEDLLCRFDLGLSGIAIEKRKRFDDEKKQEREVFLPFGAHQVNGQSYKLPLYGESGGTKVLFVTLQKVLDVLGKGGVAILDEFDSDLHPDVIPELVNLFSSKNYNPRNAQLLFSTHHPQILNELEKYQVLLVEKDEKTSKSEVWRLDEQEGRPDVNYYKKYISGAYGAIPNIK